MGEQEKNTHNRTKEMISFSSVEELRTAIENGDVLFDVDHTLIEDGVAVLKELGEIILKNVRPSRLHIYTNGGSRKILESVMKGINIIPFNHDRMSSNYGPASIEFFEAFTIAGDVAKKEGLNERNPIPKDPALFKKGSILVDDCAKAFQAYGAKAITPEEMISIIKGVI